MKKLLSVLFLLSFTLASVYAQNIQVKGTVVSGSDNEPLPGVNVVEKGNATNGAITDLDGNFTVSVPANATLSITYIGFKPQDIALNGRKTLKIVLQEDSEALDEVVVVGYGVQKKSVVTASIAKVGADELAISAPVRVDNALKGLAAGVQVTAASGQPGEASRIRIRGVGTVNNSDPLYIVDGMPIDGGIDYLNPNDIQSIEVLKDAASGAVYGARAANGVVLVTTKGGKIGKTKVTYDFSMGFQSPWKHREVLDATQYAIMRNEASMNDGTGMVYADPYSYGKGTDWQKEVFNDNAPVVQHQVSASGATDKLNYYLSLGYYEQEGIVGGNYDRSNYRRMTMRSNTNYTMFDVSKERSWLNKLTVGVNLAYSRIKSKSIGTNSETGSVLGSALSISPILSPYMSEGTTLKDMIAANPSMVLSDGTVLSPLQASDGRYYTIPGDKYNEITNPLANLSLPGALNNSDKFVANFFAELTLWDSIKFKSSYGQDLAFWGTDGWTPVYYLSKQNKAEYSSVSSEMHRGSVWQLENTLSWDKTFGQHSFQVLLGQSAKKSTGRYLKGNNRYMIEERGDKANIDFTTGTQKAGDMYVAGSLNSPSTIASYFGRLSYNFAERYMLQLTVRRDGSSNFGSNNKWATFPSVSLGWNLTNESFMKNRPAWLTSTKVRGSWGKNGNESIGAFGYVALTSSGNNHYFGKGDAGQIITGTKPSGLSNADLKWEESEQTDFGVDFGFFNNALTFTVDYFYKKTNGMLKTMPIPSYVGESKPTGNVGDMENRGWELEANYKFHVSDWNFRIGANASYIKNKLINLGNDSGFEMSDYLVGGLSNVTRAENGYVYPFFYGRVTDGIFQNWAEINAYAKDGKLIQPNAQPGDIRFKDLNDDGKIDDDNDKAMIGKGMPDWTYGINFQASWKNFDFSMMIAGAIGNDIFDATRRCDIAEFNLPKWIWENRWTGEGTSNNMPRMTITDPNASWSSASDLYIKDGSYMRLKNIQLGYTLPQWLTQKVFVDRLRVYVAAENLLTFTKYDGLDPEIANGTSMGLDKGIYPQARVFTFGLNISF
ncbi:TonB-dependent receptor [Bacteroides helcogenes]|uniref:TonB-dependent receptor plug n=1 Tax=Bacteroides helcogenes (strain ATCC 35417 / DSM 20613 / JCM 6297 / CCUG 15421 / P 36-108) TaxID=693979 RepID=E6SMZ5_BACT6|nr:TonB-dependent receptor [Bacteroides helcogenes]ADV43664.1 TonB-dependent receptor plug [Bacteroides helcogenes P 36-108]MDY5239386.1 TonB-dependent receptor [Bacteroides helcogenes]